MLIEQAAALGIAFLIGMLLGAMGSGGSIVTLPVLVYIAGIHPQSAVPMSMVVVGSASAFAAYLHARRGRFHLKAALLLGTTGVVGAYLGSAGTHTISSRSLMLIFATLLLVVGGLMLSSGLTELSPKVCRPVRCLAVGAGVGLLTGFLGVGGGFLIVPALVVFAGLETKVAIGTSLAIIALNSAAGFVGQIRYADLDWTLTLWFSGLTLLGMLTGIRVSERMPEVALRRGFAFIIIAVGLVVGGLNLFGV